MILGVELVPAWFSTPLTIGLLAVTGWYWMRLGESDVPASRRRIRRISSLIAIFGLPFLAAGLSWIDADRAPRQFVLVWVIVMGLLLAFVITAIFDIINSLRLVQAHEEELPISALRRLRETDDDGGAGD